MSVEYFTWMYNHHVVNTKKVGKTPDSLRNCVRKTIHSYVWKGQGWPSKAITDRWTRETEAYIYKLNKTLITDRMRREASAADRNHHLVLRDDY